MRFTIAVAAILAPTAAVAKETCSIPPPPEPEPIETIELLLPPVSPSGLDGSCTLEINPRKTGCVALNTTLSYQFQSGSFTPDGKHVVALIEYVGAPPPPNPASIYMGQQIILVKADGTTFPNGDTWKCLTCGVPPERAVGLSTATIDYPQTFYDGKRAMYGSNIIDCGTANLADADCTPDTTFIYPIRWNSSADPSASGGSIRELRLHADNVHVLFSALTSTSETAYVGRLQFNPAPTTGLPRAPRYDLVNVYGLYNANNSPKITVKGDEMFINQSAITVGEARGFNGLGTEILYIGSSFESCNIDITSVSIATGKVRRYTEHPEYCDPISWSPDGEWSVIMDTRGSGRMMFLAGMRYVPPIIDMLVGGVVSSVRNNGNRRFFQPYLLDKYGDRGNYFGQKLNGGNSGILGSGALDDPQWNGMTDPRWSPDGTRIVYYQNQATYPECGGTNPLPCFPSTESQGRAYRLFVATLTKRVPKLVPPPPPIPDIIPWGTLYEPGSSQPAGKPLPEGTFTLKGAVSGSATVVLMYRPGTTSINFVGVSYHNFTDDGLHFISGNENVTLSGSGMVLHLDWYSEMYQSGAVTATKLTGPDGFHITIDELAPIFEANGTLVTTVDGVAWTQPGNGD